MNKRAQGVMNLLTVALLLAAVATVSICLTVDEDICLRVDNAFYAFHCGVERSTPVEDTPAVITTDHTLTGTHLGPIMIADDGVTLDCAGHEIRGIGEIGIEVAGRSNVTIKNCRIAGFQTGIALVGSTDSRVLDNEMDAGASGITLTDSSGNELRGNAATLTTSGIALERSDSNEIVENTTKRGLTGIVVLNSGTNTVRGNLVLDAKYGITIRGSGNHVDGNTIETTNRRNGGVFIDGSRNEVTNNKVLGGSSSIEVSGTDTTVSGNDINSFGPGVVLRGSGHSILDNTVYIYESGIVIWADDSTISRNHIGRGNIAISLIGARGNLLTDNFVEGGQLGFRIENALNNTLRGNDASRAMKGVDGTAATVRNTFTDNFGFNLSEPLVVMADTTLEADYFGTIVIGADGVTLDCAGMRVSPQQPGEAEPITHEVGIRVQDRTSVTVRNCSVVGYEQGIVLWNTSDSSVVASTAPISLSHSHGNEVSDNVSSAITLISSHRNSVTRNTLADGAIKLKESDRNTVHGNDVTGAGIVLSRGEANTVDSNIVTDGWIRISQSSGATVRNNDVVREEGTAYMIGQIAPNNLIADNVARGGEIGFLINNSADNTLSGNVALDSEVGFMLRNVRTSTFIGNTSGGKVHRGRGTVGNTFTDNIGF